MMRSHDFHIVMHLMVMASATLMVADRGRRRGGAPALARRALYLFLLSFSMMLVAALITFMGSRCSIVVRLRAPPVGPGGGRSALGGADHVVPGTMYYWGVTVVYFQWAKQDSHSDDRSRFRPRHCPRRC
jgi:hypothetical protein